LEKSTRLGNSSFLSFNDQKEKKGIEETNKNRQKTLIYVRVCKRTNQHI
jgi:hypothetical protein